MDYKFREDFLKLLADCRKHGVESVKVDGFELKLRPEAPPSSYKKKKLEAVSDSIETDPIYDEEAALFWSSAGIPEEKVSN